MIFHQGGLSSGWFFIRVVFYQGGLSSGWSFTGGSTVVLISGSLSTAVKTVKTNYVLRSDCLALHMHVSAGKQLHVLNLSQLWGRPSEMKLE